MKLIRNLIHWLVGYNVIVSWEGKRIVHKALSPKEAWQWVAAYPYNAKIQIVPVGGKHAIASRGFASA